MKNEFPKIMNSAGFNTGKAPGGYLRYTSDENPVITTATILRDLFDLLDDDQFVEVLEIFKNTRVYCESGITEIVFLDVPYQEV
jgi:hypothetical protein